MCRNGKLIKGLDLWSVPGSDTYAADLGSTGSSVDYTITATAIDGLSNPASSISNSLSITVDLDAPSLQERSTLVR